MKIESIAYRVPSWEASNADILALLDKQNPSISGRQKHVYLKIVEKLLKQTGAKTRYLRDTHAGENASELICGAIQDALDQAHLQAGDVDLLIYCGVGRGFIEPANAYFYAKAMGMETANCFDITDACMSWIRATHVAQLMLKSGAFKRAMIINGEFHLGFHDNWEIRDVRSLDYAFPMYTIGEAATATILVDSPEDWKHAYSSQPERADLCTIPLAGYESFVENSDARIGNNGVGRFSSYGRELFQSGIECLGELILKVIENPDQNLLYFPHAPSRRVYEENMPKYGIPANRVFLDVYPRFGNLVSASIPVGLSIAESEGKIKSGDPIALVPVSAGIVASVVELNF